MVVAVVGAALALFETVLPWAFAVLRKRRRRAKKTGEEEKNAPRVESKAVVREGASDGQRTEDDGQRVETDGQRIEDDGHGVADDGQKVEAPETVDTADAERLWEEARTIPHNFKPDWKKDREYLTKVYGAAKLGHLEAMVKVGDYAYRRGAVVEAYYWTALAELKGAEGLDETLRKLKARWISKGFPSQRSNVYDEFTERQGSFARALLRIRCAVDTPLARARMRELADLGCEEARLFMGRLKS